MAEAEVVVERRVGVPVGTFDALRFRDFRLLWFGMLSSSVVLPLQFFVQAWFVQTHADKDVRLLLLGVLGAVRGSAGLGFNLFGGALADRMDRRRLLYITQWSGLIVAALTGFLFIADLLPEAWLFAALFVLFFTISAVSAVDAPARSAMIPELVERPYVTNAIALNSTAMQIAIPISVFFSGLFIEHLGLGVTYLLSTGAYVVGLASLWLMRYRSHVPDRRSLSMLDNIREGLAYAAREPTVLWVLIITFVTTGFGFPVMVTLASAWFDQVLGLDAEGWSRIAVFWGVFALATSLALASLGDFRNKGRIFVLSGSAYGLAIVAFGLSRWLPAVALANGAVGALGTVNLVTGTAVLQAMVPNQYLGRVMSLSMMSMGFAQVNGLTMGALAQGIGLETVLPLMGGLIAASVLGLGLAVPQLRRIA